MCPLPNHFSLISRRHYALLNARALLPALLFSRGPVMTGYHGIYGLVIFPILQRPGDLRRDLARMWDLQP